ncbi:MAG: sigma 54-interacting transcriptional regulator [Planctomycetaceae bacterium]
MFRSETEKRLVRAIALLANSNPFEPQRMDLERRALGDQFEDDLPVWSWREDRSGERPNLLLLIEQGEDLIEHVRQRKLPRVTDEDRGLYIELALFVLYHRHRNGFQALIDASLGQQGTGQSSVSLFKRFCSDAGPLLEVDWLSRDAFDLPHMFAYGFQLRRAFHNIYSHIIGGSMPAARLRAQVWQSIFTYDMCRYRRLLFGTMQDISTLITGPTGTGKELVVRAIALSGYVPFDGERRAFEHDWRDMFHGVNLSAWAATLIESELFGHCRGAFTGAVSDRLGWFEQCHALDCVFLDEIGELDVALQVKLLRVLQSRRFQRVGETKDREFLGRIIAATNQDLAVEIEAGRFREDLYYRLCSDVMQTPSLHEQIRDSPGELRHLVHFIVSRMVPAETDVITQEITEWIEQSLGLDYPWPGNIRELEQCVRNVLIRNAYQPLSRTPGEPADQLADDVRRNRLTSAELLGRYYAQVFAATGSYEQASRLLDVDRRTVKTRMNVQC